MLEHKLIYLETKDVVETTLALDNYKRACDSGRGAVFLSVARGTVVTVTNFYPQLPWSSAYKIVALRCSCVEETVPILVNLFL